MPLFDPKTKALVERVLKNTDLFPDEFKSWLTRQVNADPTLKLERWQLPNEVQPPYVSTIAAGPPQAPFHNQLWIATDVDASALCWKFRYNAKSSSAYKWEFVGGDSFASGPSGNLNTTTTGWTALTSGPSITVPRDGDYAVDVGVTAICSVFTAVYFGIARANFGGATGNGIQLGCPIQWVGAAMSSFQFFTGRTAAQTVTVEMQNDRAAAGTTAWSLGWLKVVPVRIS